MSAILPICIGQSIFSTIPLGLHLIGIYLLKTTSSYAQNQQLYLIQLSVTEVMFLVAHNNIILYLKIFQVLPLFTSYLSLFLAYFIEIPWCNVMILLTLDRFAQFWLNINYDVYVNALGAMFAVLISWLVGGVLFLLMVCTDYVLKMKSHRLIHMLETKIFMAMVVFISVVSYSYICYKVSYKKNNMNYNGGLTRRKAFVPFWIVLFFFFFYVLPSIVQLILEHNNQLSNGMAAYYYIGAMVFSDIGCLGDVLVYTFMDDCTRKKFFRFLRCDGSNRKLTANSLYLEDHACQLTSVKDRRSFRMSVYSMIWGVTEPSSAV